MAPKVIHLSTDISPARCPQCGAAPMPLEGPHDHGLAVTGAPVKCRNNHTWYVAWRRLEQPDPEAEAEARRYRKIMRGVLRDLERRGRGDSTEAHMCRSFLRRSTTLYRHLHMVREGGSA